MNKESDYELIYRLMIQGGFSDVYLSPEEGFIVGLDPKRIRKFCRKRDVDYNEFMEYAQERKAKENAE